MHCAFNSNIVKLYQNANFKYGINPLILMMFMPFEKHPFKHKLIFLILNGKCFIFLPLAKIK